MHWITREKGDLDISIHNSTEVDTNVIFVGSSTMNREVAMTMA